MLAAAGLRGNDGGGFVAFGTGIRDDVGLEVATGLSVIPIVKTGEDGFVPDVLLDALI